MRIEPSVVGEIRARVRIEDVVGRRVTLKKAGRELAGLCPFHDEKTPSFTVVPAKRFFYCFGCGAHGDVIGFVMRIDGLDFPAAVARLGAEAGIAGAPDPAQARRDRERRARQDAARAAAEAARLRSGQATAREIWRGAGPADGTLVETYLAARGIDRDLLGGLPASLRFAPALWHSPTRTCRPAMVAAVQGPDGGLVAVHRTWLEADGRARIAKELKPKMMRGPVWGAALRFGRADGERLGGGEGIETSLSVLLALREAGDGLPIWALLSLGNFAGAGVAERRPTRHPQRPDKTLPSPVPDLERPGFLPPPGVREFTWFADGDGDPFVAERLLARAQARYDAAGCRLRIARPPRGMDFNDVLRSAA